jgi:hypothetical protein
MLQGTIAAFGDPILSSAEEIGRRYSRFREQALRIRKGKRRTIETFASARCSGPASARVSLESVYDVHLR